MNNFFWDKTWTKKKNIDKETERLIDLYFSASEDDRESPEMQPLIEELKRRNPADVNAIIYDTIRRIVALNKAAENYPKDIDFRLEFGRNTINLSVDSWNDAIWFAELLKKDKTLPDRWTCHYHYYWLHIYEEVEPEYFLAKWERFMGLR